MLAAQTTSVQPSRTSAVSDGDSFNLLLDSVVRLEQVNLAHVGPAF